MTTLLQQWTTRARCSGCHTIFTLKVTTARCTSDKRVGWVCESCSIFNEFFVRVPNSIVASAKIWPTPLPTQPTWWERLKVKAATVLRWP